MANTTTISANMIIDAHEEELREEAIDQCFFTPLTTDAARKPGEAEDVPEGIVERKTEVLQHGERSIKFGAFLQLSGEGTFEDKTLIGQGEEALENLESEIFFSEANHAVPYDVKGLNAHLNKAYDLVKKPRKALSTWHGQYQEQCGWQAFFRRHNTRINQVYGNSKAPLFWHPNIFTSETGGLTRVNWTANQTTYVQSISTAINNLGAGDVFNADRVYQAGVEADNLKLVPVKITVDGVMHEVLIWAYPRRERVRIKKAFESFWLQGDVRGPNNRALKGDLFKFDRFLFVEAAHIPQIVRVDANTISLLESWGVNNTTKKRSDQRGSTTYAHAIMGAKALAFAEPEELTWKAVEVDGGRKETLASFRLFGYGRNTEWFDNMYAPTKHLSQGGMIVLANAA